MCRLRDHLRLSVCTTLPVSQKGLIWRAWNFTGYSTTSHDLPNDTLLKSGSIFYYYQNLTAFELGEKRDKPLMKKIPRYIKRATLFSHETCSPDRSPLPGSGRSSSPSGRVALLLEPAAMSSSGWMISILNTLFFCHRFNTRTILLCNTNRRHKTRSHTRLDGIQQR